MPRSKFDAAGSKLRTESTELLAGDLFQSWLSSLPNRSVPIQRARKTLEQQLSRVGVEKTHVHFLISYLERSGHIERIPDHGGRIVATPPTLAVNCVEHTGATVRAEWIGSRTPLIRARIEHENLIRFEQTVSFPSFTRWFLHGESRVLHEIIQVLGGTVQIFPGRRILSALPATSPDTFVGELASTPIHDSLERMEFSTREPKAHWKHMRGNKQFDNGVYRHRLQSRNWLWFEHGKWRRLDGEQRSWAAWYQAAFSNKIRMEFHHSTKLLRIRAIGIALPILLERALRLGYGNPLRNQGYIEFTGVDVSDIIQLQRILHIRAIIQ